MTQRDLSIQDGLKHKLPGLYTGWFPSQPDFCKFGGSKQIINRGSSDVYFTPHASVGQFRVWYTDDYDFDWRDAETKLKNYIFSVYEPGTAGREMFKSDHSCKDIIHSFIFENTDLKYYCDIDVLELRKLSSYKHDKLSLTLITYTILKNESVKCELCSKISTNKSYECVVVDGKTGNLSTIYTGPTCFKKISTAYIKSKAFNNFLITSLTNPNYNQKEDPPDDTDETDDTNYLVDNVVVCYIDKFSVDKRSAKIKIQNDIIVKQLPYNCLQMLIIHYMCEFLLNKEKKLKTDINNSFLSEFNLDINLSVVYGFAQDCTYFHTELYEEDDNTVKGEFGVELRYPILNTPDLISFYTELKSKPISMSNTKEYNLSGKQQEILQSTKPITSGQPGTGKSQIAKNIIDSVLNSNSNESVILIAPTHSTRADLSSPFKNHTDFTSIVIDALNSKRKDIIGKTCLIVDEWGQLDIFSLYKIMRYITENSDTLSVIKFFGDKYQLPSTFLEEETKELRDSIHDISNKITENHRYDDTCKKAIFLESKKSKLSSKNIHTVFPIESYNEKTILYQIDDGYVFLAHRNKTVNKINDLANKKRSKRCKECPSDIHVQNYLFCKKCIQPVKFVLNKNIKYDKINQDDMNYEICYSTSSVFTNTILRHKITGRYVYPKVNDAENTLFHNGEIVSIEKHDEYYVLSNEKTGNKRIITSLNNIGEIKLTYALTVHKSQGRTYNKIAFMIDGHSITSPLIYTALTRAREIENIQLYNSVPMITIEFTKTLVFSPKSGKYHGKNKTYLDIAKEDPTYVRYFKESNIHYKFFSDAIKMANKTTTC
jgi:hypothetical protein